MSETSGRIKGTNLNYIAQLPTDLAQYRFAKYCWWPLYMSLKTNNPPECRRIVCEFYRPKILERFLFFLLRFYLFVNGFLVTYHHLGHFIILYIGIGYVAYFLRGDGMHTL